MPGTITYYEGREPPGGRGGLGAGRGLGAVRVKFLVGGWLLAWPFLDYPLGLGGLGAGARLLWAGRNFGAFTAFGLGWAVLLVVPGTFLLVLPMGVAGATQLVVAGERRR